VSPFKPEGSHGLVRLVRKHREVTQCHGANLPHQALCQHWQATHHAKHLHFYHRCSSLGRVPYTAHAREGQVLRSRCECTAFPCDALPIAYLPSAALFSVSPHVCTE
jgi:hypothetical protein